MTVRRICSVVLAAAVAACGGGEPAQSGGGGGGQAPQAPAASLPAPSGPMTMPDWYQLDEAARTVQLSIVAGQVPDNNYWNLNGTTNGGMAITVPEGYRVVVEYENRDPNMAHSLGVSAERSNFAVPPQPNPVFAGAITQNPASMIDATMPGDVETFEFVADRAGEYSFVCYIPGHSAVGMWMFFNVSSGAEAGVQTR